nr:hypothetical protein B0A51_10607 [Rachicladosporium sp. CCFEE 5018]
MEAIGDSMFDLVEAPATADTAPSPPPQDRSTRSSGSTATREANLIIQDITTFSIMSSGSDFADDEDPSVSSGDQSMSDGNESLSDDDKDVLPGKHKATLSKETVDEDDDDESDEDMADGDEDMADDDEDIAEDDDDASTSAAIDLDTQCGVKARSGKICEVDLECRFHSAAMKAAVQGRSKPFAELLKTHVPRAAATFRAINLDYHCAVMTEKGVPCKRAITCTNHLKAEKEAVKGRTKTVTDIKKHHDLIHRRSGHQEATDPHPDTECFVTLPDGTPCARNIICNIHTTGEKRQVPGRSEDVQDLINKHQAGKPQKKKKAKLPDPNVNCCVPLPHGGVCPRLIGCMEYLTAAKEAVEGRADTVTNMMRKHNDEVKQKKKEKAQQEHAAHEKALLMSATHCSVVGADGSKCLQDLSCSIHTKAEKDDVPRTALFANLLKTQIANQRAFTLRPGVFGLAAAAAHGQSYTAIRKRFRHNGMQTASPKVDTAGEVAGPDFQWLDPAGPNLARIRQVLYEQTDDFISRGLGDTIGSKKMRTLNAEHARFIVHEGRYVFVLCTSANKVPKTYAKAMQELQTATHVEMFVVSASEELYDLDKDKAAAILTRLRDLLQRVGDKLSKLTAQYKHLLLISAMVHDDAFEGAPLKIPAKFDIGIVNGKPSILFDTVQFEPSAWEPQTTQIAIPLHDTRAIVTSTKQPHADWYEVSGLDVGKPWLNVELSAEEQEALKQTALSIFAELHLVIAEPRRVRWLLSLLSKMHDRAILIRLGDGDITDDAPSEDELATYDDFTGTITPSAHLAAHAHSLVTIQGIKSDDAAFYVLQCLKCRFMHTRDILLAWSDACNSADWQQSSDLHDQTSSCICSVDEQQESIHCCRACGSPHICNTLIQIVRNGSHVKLCGQCTKPNKPASQDNDTDSGGDSSTDDEAHKQDTGSANTELARVRQNVARLCKEEHRLVFSDYADAVHQRQREIKEAKHVIKEYFQRRGNPAVWHWDDAYFTTNITASEGLMGCSVEAVSPVVWCKGKPRYHIAHNLVAIPLYANRLLGNFHPSILPLIHTLDAATSEQERDEIVQRLDMHWVIRAQIPWGYAARLTTPIDEDAVQTFNAQCQTGVPTTSGCARIADYDTKHGPYLWRIAMHKKWESVEEEDLPEIDAVKQFILDIEEETGIKLPRLHGVYYPFKGGPEPSDWTYGMLYGKVYYHFDVLLHKCNKRWITEYDPPRLICAIIFLLCHPEINKPLLNLPLSLYTRHILKISIGKDDHSRSMTCGLSMALDILLSNFVPEDCNLCIEPWASNSAIGNRDDQRAAVADHFRTALKQTNPPLWDEDLADLPARLVKKYITEAQNKIAIGEFDEDDSGTPSGYGSTGGQPRGEADGGGRGAGGGDARDRAAEAAVIARYRNMKNMGQTCYLSSAVQTLYFNPDLRAFLNDPTQLVAKAENGRPDGRLLDVVVNDMQKSAISRLRKKRMEQLSEVFTSVQRLFATLDAGGAQLPSTDTANILGVFTEIDNRWQNVSDESAGLMTDIIDWIVTVSDSSEPEGRGKTKKYNDEQIANNKAGRELFPVEIDRTIYRGTFRDEGATSQIVDYLYPQVVQEIPCGSPECKVTARSYENSPVIYLEFPVSAKPDDVLALDDLLRVWHHDGSLEGRKCEHVPTHPSGKNLYRCIVKPTKWICFALRRGHRLQLTQPQLVNAPEELDLAPYMDLRHLPTTRPGPPQLSDKDNSTVYDLASATNWIRQGPHYIAYNRIWDSTTTRWIMFNDLLKTPLAVSPSEGAAKGELLSYAVYRRREIGAPAPAAAASTTNPSGSGGPPLTTLGGPTGKKTGADGRPSSSHGAAPASKQQKTSSDADAASARSEREKELEKKVAAQAAELAAAAAANAAATAAKDAELDAMRAELARRPTITPGAVPADLPQAIASLVQQLSDMDGAQGRAVFAKTDRLTTLGRQHEREKADLAEQHEREKADLAEQQEREKADLGRRQGRQEADARAERDAEVARYARERQPIQAERNRLQALQRNASSEG